MSSLWTPSGERPVRPTPDQPPGTPRPSVTDRHQASGAPASAPGPTEQRRTARPAGGPADAAEARPDHGSSARADRGSSARPDHAEHQAAAEDLERLRRELLATPAAVVVANHAYGLFELAAIHLSAQPPNLAEAGLAIDALGALVSGVGDRLGDVRGALADALAQIRLAFVQVSAAAGPGPSAAGEGPSAPSA